MKKGRTLDEERTVSKTSRGILAYSPSVWVYTQLSLAVEVVLLGMVECSSEDGGKSRIYHY